MNSIKKSFLDSIELKKLILKNSDLSVLQLMGNEIVEAIQNNKKIIFCGNGGSAADAQHLAAEMLIRLKPQNNRIPISAIALAQDTSTITACGNDFGFEIIYERLLEGLGKDGDILVPISTSGNSKNIVLAIKKAKEMNIQSFAFLGSNGGDAKSICDRAFIVPSDDTARIQECHITAGHALMEYVEDKLIELNFIKTN